MDPISPMRSGSSNQEGYLASWSGGKDSCFALYHAVKSGKRIAGLLNCIQKENGRVSFHGVDRRLVQAQADLLGVPLLQKETTAGRYAEEFKEGVRELGADQRIAGMVFGDIYLDEHLAWVEGICKDLGITAIEPLWGRDTAALLREFIDNGFRSVIIAADSRHIDAEWIGREIDHEFRKYLGSRPGVDPCGERGEYHSLVVGGPLFRGKIEIRSAEIVERNGYRFLDVRQFDVIQHR